MERRSTGVEPGRRWATERRHYRMVVREMEREGSDKKIQSRRASPAKPSATDRFPNDAPQHRWFPGSSRPNRPETLPRNCASLRRLVRWRIRLSARLLGTVRTLYPDTMPLSTPL